jgi:DNA-binding FadR family transcriptional regulator
MFVALEPRRLHRQVADQIRALIEAGELALGAKLPAERDLAERFAVSRPTVREALIVLEVEGYIHIRMGSGVYVTNRLHPAPAILPVDDSDGPFEILQARSIIESAIAEEAAKLATPGHVAALDACLQRMESAIGNPVNMLVHDRAFHTAITDIIGNATLHNFTGHIFDRRMTPYFERLASHFEGPETWRAALEEHTVIRNAIAANDGTGARDAMRRHLRLSQKRFSESFGEEP